MNAISGTRRTMKEMADGTIRVQIDIDPMCRTDFLAMFPNIDMPVAIAPLVPDFERGTDTLPERVDEKPESEQKERASGLWLLAVHWCKEPSFWKWLNEIHDFNVAGNEADAAHWLKDYCMIESRRELNDNPRAIATFNQDVRGPYMAWMERKA